MPEDAFPRPSGATRERGGEVTYLEHALWQQLAAAQTREEFCRSWLELQCRIIGRVHAGAVVLGSAEPNTFAPAAFWPANLRERKHIAAVAEQALRERRGVVTRSDEEGAERAPEQLRFLVAYPVWDEDELHGVAALELAPRPQPELQSAMRQLQWGTAGLCNWVLRQRSGPERRLRARLAQALDLTAFTLQHRGFREASTTFATELATRLECDRVGIGWYRGGRCRLVALSHTAEFRRQMKVVQAIQDAMDEATEQQATVLVPSEAESERRIVRAHEVLRRDHGDAAVCTVPFVGASGESFGAIVLERCQDRPFDAETVLLLESVAALVAPILDEKRRNSRLFPAKAWESFRWLACLLVGPRHVGVKLTAAALAGTVLFFCFATGEYRVTSKGKVEGAVQRSIVAPYAGFVYATPAKAGDVLRAGQELCRLDDRDLRLERLKWVSVGQQRRFEYRKAVGEGKTAESRILQEQIRQAEAQVTLLDDQLRRARVTAPFDGVVVSGDLSQALGAPVEKGQVLFELAPLNAYRLVLEVDERYIRDLQPRQSGELLLASLPRTDLRFTVTRVTPASAPREGRNYFRVEGEIAGPSPLVRPGMEGFAKVAVDRRKLFWIWTHELVDHVRLWFWSWWP